MKEIILRPYQEKAVIKVLQSMKRTNKQVLVLATGTGKTVIFSHLIDQLITATGKKALVLAHREELLQQAKEKLRAVNPKLKIEIEQGGNYSKSKKVDVVIASVPTLGRVKSTRLTKFRPDEFCAIIVDEAHHSTTETYKTILRYFGVLKKQDGENVNINDWNKDCLLLGVTATPSRTDNKGINQVFDKVAYEYHIIRAIKDGYLANIRAFSVNTRTDLSRVGKVAGDFNQGELAETVNNKERNRLIVKAYIDNVPQKQALIFCVDIKHTQDVALEFQENGIKSAYITGNTKKDQRKKILQDFSKGKIKALVNCMTLTEGIDVPSVEAVLLARPTQSSILFSQMIGRGTRLYPGKDNLTIIDFVDATNTQKLQTSASLLGLNGVLQFQGQDILDVKKKIDRIIELSPNFQLSTLDLSQIDYTIKEIDIIGGLKTPQEITNLTSLDWFRFRENYYRLSLPENRTMHLYQTITNEYEILDEGYNPDTRTKEAETIATVDDIKKAFTIADDYINFAYPQYKTLLSSSASWRELPVKDGQLFQLRKMGISEMQISQLNRGTASRLLSKLFAFTPSQRKQYIAPSQGTAPAMVSTQEHLF